MQAVDCGTDVTGGTLLEVYGPIINIGLKETGKLASLAMERLRKQSMFVGTFQT